MGNTPSQRPRQRQTPNIDRISDLPDSILCHILSFLPTKQTATTSILSKRWKTVRFSVLALDFDSQTFKDFNSFRKFIYSTMSSIKVKNIPIHSFSFKCDSSSHFTQQNYDKIFKFEMLGGVQNLNFDMSNKKRISKLPPRIFSFKMLQTLKLKNLDMGDFNQVDFPHLKILHLNSVLFISPKYFVKFLLGCPILEDLQLMLSTDATMKNLSNALPNIVRVRIDWNFAPLSLVWNANILQLEKVARVTWTKLPMFSNVTHLELSFEGEYFVGDKTLLGLLPHVPKLQHLKIQDDFGVLSKCIDCWDGSFVSECLSLHLKTCYIIGYRGSEYELGFAKYIMQHSKVLDTMTIKSICLCDLETKKNKRKITCPEKNQMLVNLSLCTMGSPMCKLLFE